MSPLIYSADSPQANLKGVGMKRGGYMAGGVQRGQPSGKIRSGDMRAAGF